jgi:hypothetical protein
MLKLFRIKPCENNKSCSIHHNEPNKIGLEFFLNFLNFLCNLKESANLQILLKLYFCAEAPGKIRPFAMWPLAMAGGAGRPNSGEPLVGAGGARAGVDPWVLGDRFRGSVVEGERPVRWGAGGQVRWPPRPLYRRWGLDAGAWERLVS